MKHQIKTTKTGSVEISVDVSEEERAKVMSSFEACQRGQCGCPTQAYSKVGKMDLTADEDGININLEPIDGAVIETAEVEKCMTWTKDQLQEK